jgi:hypothetical protein
LIVIREVEGAPIAVRGPLDMSFWSVTSQVARQAG